MEPNDHLRRLIQVNAIAVVNVDVYDLDVMSASRTELDSHANMTVIGRHSIVLNKTGKSVDVNPFSLDYD